MTNLQEFIINNNEIDEQFDMTYFSTNNKLKTIQCNTVDTNNTNNKNTNVNSKHSNRFTNSKWAKNDGCIVDINDFSKNNKTKMVGKRGINMQ